MPRKSSIQTLPQETLDQLNKQIAEGTRTLDELTEWLDEEGHPRSRSSLHRYSQQQEKVLAKLRQSRQITEAFAKELGESSTQGKQGRLLVEMARSLVFDLMTKLQEAEDGTAIDTKDVAFLGKGLAELGRALRFDQDFETKIREQVAKEYAERAVAAAQKLAKEKGVKLGKEALEQIRRDVGITRE